MEIFTFNGFGGQHGWTSGQGPFTGLRTFTAKRKDGATKIFTLTPYYWELTLRRGRGGTEAYRIIGLLAISVKTCESAAKGEVQSHYIRIKRYKAGYIAEFLSFDADA